MSAYLFTNSAKGQTRPGPTGSGRREVMRDQGTDRCWRTRTHCDNGYRGSRRVKLSCAKGRPSCSRPQRLLELERLAGRDLLAADAVSLGGQVPRESAAVLCEADRWPAEVALLSLDETSGVAGEYVVGETPPRPCRWQGCPSPDAGCKPLPTIGPLPATELASLDTVFHPLWNTAAIESLWRNCADPAQAGGSLDLSLQELSQLEPISLAPWFAPSLPRLAAPLAPVAPDDWARAFARCYADLPVWEIPDRLLLEASLVEDFEQFSSCDPHTASEFAELIFQQAEEVLEQPEVADWLDGDWIPSWLQVGALAGGMAAIGTTIWYGVPEWEHLPVTGSLAVDCAEILAGSRIELPTTLDGGEAGSLSWRLNGEYWPFGANGIRGQENLAALGFSGHARYLSDQRHVQWTSDITLGFDRTGIQAGNFDLSGSFIENRAQIDLVVSGSYGDGPGFADGVGQLSVGLSGSGPLPLTAGTLTDRLRFAGRVKYAAEVGSQREQRSEFAIWGSLRAEY